MIMSSSESPEDLRPAEDPQYFRKRKVSKTILDALGVSCQVAPSSAGERALLEVDPAVATHAVAESDVAVTIASPTTNEAAVVTPVGVPMSTGLPPRFEFSDKFERHERKFVLVTCGVCLILMAGCVIASAAAPTTFGEFYPAIATNFAIIFLAEVVWRALLSCVAYRYASRYKRTINYTRKLGNCFKLYKLFVFSDFLPNMRKDPLTLLFIFSLDQLLYIIMFSHFVRRRENPLGWICRFLFLQQDRPEDRPDTLIYQVTEDLMRFAVYLPFKLYGLSRRTSLTTPPLSTSLSRSTISEMVSRSLLACTSLLGSGRSGIWT